MDNKFVQVHDDLDVNRARHERQKLEQDEIKVDKRAMEDEMK